MREEAPSVRSSESESVRPSARPSVPPSLRPSAVPTSRPSQTLKSGFRVTRPCRAAGCQLSESAVRVNRPRPLSESVVKTFPELPSPFLLLLPPLPILSLLPSSLPYFLSRPRPISTSRRSLTCSMCTPRAHTCTLHAARSERTRARAHASARARTVHHAPSRTLTVPVTQAHTHAWRGDGFAAWSTPLD